MLSCHTIEHSKKNFESRFECGSTFYRNLLVSLLSSSFVCLFTRTISQKTDHQTWHRNVPRWVLEARLFLFWSQKVRGQGHESKKTLGLCTRVSAGFFWLIYCSSLSSLSVTTCWRKRCWTVCCRFTTCIRKAWLQRTANSWRKSTPSGFNSVS